MDFSSGTGSVPCPNRRWCPVCCRILLLWNDSYTALRCAANYGYTEICCLLLDRGANIGKKDNNRNSALIRVDNINYVEVCCMFLNRGANTNEKNDNGNTKFF